MFNHVKFYFKWKGLVKDTTYKPTAQLGTKKWLHTSSEKWEIKRQEIRTDM